MYIHKIQLDETRICAQSASKMNAVLTKAGAHIICSLVQTMPRTSDYMLFENGQPQLSLKALD